MTVPSYSAVVNQSNMDGKLMRTIKLENCEFINEIVSSGETLAAICDLFNKRASSKLSLWNIDGIFLKSLAIDAENVSALAFSPEGKRLITGEKNGTLKLWNKKGSINQDV